MNRDQLDAEQRAVRKAARGPITLALSVQALTVLIASIVEYLK